MFCSVAFPQVTGLYSESAWAWEHSGAPCGGSGRNRSNPPLSQNIRYGLFTHLHERTAEAQSNSQQAERRAT